MANDEHIAILRKGVQYWNTWRKENPDIKPDLGDRWDEESPKGPQPYIHFNDLDLSMIDLSLTSGETKQCRHSFMDNRPTSRMQATLDSAPERAVRHRNRI